MKQEHLVLVCDIRIYFQEKRARDFIRFGKRGDEEYEEFESDLDPYQPISPFPYKRYGSRRLSNFLRFG